MPRRHVNPILITGLMAASLTFAQRLTVTGVVSIASTGKAKTPPEGAVVWLDPVDAAQRPPTSPPPSFTIIQKDKRFDPHVLVVPVGSRVAFPNFDPFFHNVFSMFDGKRFDLGLYEAGASRTVAFPRKGVCYIFCNIHPEMTAVVVVVDTPSYGVANTQGQVSIANVPPGRYRVNVWHERAQGRAGTLPMEVSISPSNPSFGSITLVGSGQLSVTHQNKYGREYDRTQSGPNYR